MNISLGKNITIAGVIFRESTTLTGEVPIAAVTTPDVAQSGTLTTRTDANTGEITMSDVDHTIITGQRVDLYWSGGCRRGVTVGTVVTTAVPVDLGAGDDLPTTSTVIRVATPIKRHFAMIGNNLVGLFAQCTKEYQVSIVSSDSTTEVHFIHGKAGVIEHYYKQDTNPLSGDSPVFVWMSHGETASTPDVKVAALASA